MEILLNNFINALIPILVTFITGVITYGIKQALNYLKVKLGNENYTKLKNYAQDAWNITEEFFRLNPDLKTGIDSKINMFEQELKKKVPYITDEEINTFRQAIAGAINSDKPAQPTTNTVTVQPIVRYVSPEGVELQPVTNASTTAVQ